MTIYEIKRRLTESKNDTHFFDRKTLKFFGQTLKMFRVQKVDNRFFFVTCPIFIDGKNTGHTVRWYDSLNNAMLSKRQFTIEKQAHNTENTKTGE